MRWKKEYTLHNSTVLATSEPKSIKFLEI